MSAASVQVWTAGSVYQGCAAEVWAHIKRRNTSFVLVDIVQADLTSITYKVTRDGVVVVAQTTVVIATSVYDTLQTGSAWRGDSAGLNFAHTVPGTAFPDGGATYDIEYLFTPTAGGVFPVLVRVTTLSVP